ncbi:progranulin isoform 2-T2 [Anomaloglossus baeobatrachus]|uniref:progranulin isoform X2 n=1 Tax=Anomaloglossus baeobatrachus TaxID=238106 RepID=UPI003F5099A9
MVPPWSLLLLVASSVALQCPDGSTCGEGSLCCELHDGKGYGCCPEDEVVTRSLPMITSGVSCSNDEGCPDEYSCVGTPQGGSACCPFTQGTSCQDGHHCCPSGSHCSEDGHCVPASNLSAVTCPDKKSECPNDATCCQMADQTWACCPIPQATCCNDHLHCCPHATVCDLAHGKCVSENGDVPLLKKVPARVKLTSAEIVREVNCLDGSSCPDGTTCCPTEDKRYGCCPFLSAVCCSDFLHCCPSGTTCDVPHKKCVNVNFEIPMYSKIATLREEATVKCDDTASCPGTATCCRLASGEWGCCPYAQAVCCDDHEHCCPNGFTCIQGQCQQKELSIPWAVKTAAIEEATVKCDDTASCPGTATCCRLASGEWGCCPYAQAVCCDDHEHCCPNGFTCIQGQCQQKALSIPWSVKAAAIKEEATVKCDDTASCPGTATCCRLASGEWGCCPYAQAVCCDDHEHCCPNGFTCVQGQCQQKELSIPWSVKTAAIKEEATVKCDDTASCPGTATCCRLASGEWGCCPYEQAVCCDDHEHCCPNGFTCVQGQCQQKALSIPWSEKIPAIKEEATVKCDDTASCPGTATCCRLASGEWGCCPYEQAVCCDDHEHCCPNGFTCVQGQCQLEGLSIPWSEKIPAIKEKSTNVKCGDQTACPDETTCCRLASGEWGCCLYEQAVCCSDHLHCCPSGYTCDVATGSCNKPSGSLKKAAPIKPLDYVWCDASYACYDGQTCCRGVYGAWSCCPYPSGVCCPDRVHCCPYGHVCLNSGAQCSRGSLRWDLMWKKQQSRL